MNEPIISAWLIYLLGRLDSLHVFSCIIGVVLTLGTFFLLAMFISDCVSGFYDTEGHKMFLKVFKILTCVTIIIDVFAFAIPTRNEVLAMYVAKNVTPANIKATGEFADKAVDKLIEKIEMFSKARGGNK